MEGNDCGRKGKLLGGVTIFSHPWTDDSGSYGNNIECRLTFKAENDDWKLMMRVVELDIPDKSFSELCNDAVYVYDASTIMGRPFVSTMILFCLEFIHSEEKQERVHLLSSVSSKQL